jgi:cell division protein FtsW
MLRAGHVIALCVLGLLAIGVIMVISADMRAQTVNATQPIAQVMTLSDVLTSRSAIYMVCALAAMGFASLLPVRAVAEWVENKHEGVASSTSTSFFGPGVGILIVGSLVLLAVCAMAYAPGLAHEVNGSHRWIMVPGLGEALTLQPSEIAKWGMIGVVAWYCARRAKLLSAFWKGLVPALIAIGALAGFVVVEDLGTGALIGAVSALLLLAGGAKWWHFAALSPIPIAGVVAAIMTSDYRMNRIMAFADPYKDAEGIGYHTVQSLIAVSSGGGPGLGLGNSVQKLGYLPEGRTDFLFAILCEELGIGGAALVIFMLLGIVWAGVRIARDERSPMLRLIALGIVSTIALQAIINLAVVTAMAPTKGIALPLISSGGTGWLMTSFCLGIVIAIGRGHARHAHDHSQPTSTLPSVEMEAKPAASAVVEPVQEVIPEVAATPTANAVSA